MATFYSIGSPAAAAKGLQPFTIYQNRPNQQAVQALMEVQYHWNITATYHEGKQEGKEKGKTKDIGKRQHPMAVC